MAFNNASDQQITQYNLLTGAANNTINNIAPSATSGVPIISQGASAQPIFGTAAIAGGGTNATSMSTSTGIVKYDGTSLVTSTTAKIDSSNRLTNTSQPCFSASKSTTSTSVTGNGTNYTVIFDNSIFDNNSNYNTGTGTFTAPIAGKYLFNGMVTFDGVHTSNSFFVAIIATSGNFSGLSTNTVSGSNNYVYLPYTFIVSMSANDTATILVQAANGSKNVGVIGSGSSYQTYFQGYLIC